MAASIRPNRQTVSRQFPILGFTIRTGPSPAWFEVVLATEPELFEQDSGERRSKVNFYSSRVEGVLPANGTESVYLVPPSIMAQFVGQERLYYTLAIYRQPDFSNPEIVRIPPGARPFVTISKTFKGATRGRTGKPGGSARRSSNGAKRESSLVWGGDDADPGSMKSYPGIEGDGASQSTSEPEIGGSTQQSQAFIYDDGLDPDFWYKSQSSYSDHHGKRTTQSTQKDAMNTSRLDYPTMTQRNHGRQYHSQAMNAEAIVTGATFVIDKVLDNSGDITSKLPRMKGFWFPGVDKQSDLPGTGIFKTRTVKLHEPKITRDYIVTEDAIYANLEVSFDYNGKSVGEVKIIVTEKNDALGLGLHITGDITQDRNLWGDEAVAAVRLQLHYDFSRKFKNNWIAVRDMTLYGDGDYSESWRWT